MFETRRNKDQFEETVSVMETGEIEFTEKATVKKTRQTEYRNTAESGKSQSGVDV